MLNQKAISLFFLSLLILVSGHNALIHDHHGSAIAKDLSGTHHHSGDHHHHHGASDFWGWLQGVMGDFEHPDLGEQHFEIYLQPANPVYVSTTDLPEVVHIYGLNYDNGQGVGMTEHLGPVPDREHTGSDPPCLSALFSRGPPLIS